MTDAEIQSLAKIMPTLSDEARHAIMKLIFKLKQAQDLCDLYRRMAYTLVQASDLKWRMN